MDSWLYVVLGIVVLAILYFAFFRKPALPPGDEKKPELTAPSAAAKAAEATKSLSPAKAPSQKPQAAGGAEARAGQAAQEGAPPEAPSTPEALGSSDILPGSEPKQPTGAPKAAVKKDVAGIRKGLAATRGGFIARLTALFTGKKEIDPAILEQIEEVMISSDVGVKTTQAILERLRDKLQKNELADGDAVWAALRAEASRILTVDGGGLKTTGKPSVVLIVGVNGVGKTTSIGKLATRFNGEGKKVMLAAGDTFRAAAVQQLEVWGKRVGADVVKGKEGADPGAVAFEATTKAKDAGADLLLVDTAGRLHTKSPLMDEIKKVRKTIAKAMDGAPHETLLVLDATTGQNALTQATMFKEAVDLTGIILTKLDGTAKGGIVLGICDELKVPVRYIGLGERAEDLREFHPDEFVEALFGRDGDEAAAA
jgi:fused signal recognition particle receptor